MEYSKLLTLRDKLHIGDISDAFGKINLRGPLILSDQWSIIFEKKFGGFVAVSSSDPAVWWPICPCKGCQEWSAGGHYCTHMIQHLLENQQKVKEAQDSKQGPEVLDVVSDFTSEGERKDAAPKLLLDMVPKNSSNSMQIEGASSTSWMETDSPATSCFQSKLSRKKFQSIEFDDDDDDFKPVRGTKDSVPLQMLHESIQCCLDETVFEDSSIDEESDPIPGPSFEKAVDRKGIQDLIHEICEARGVDFYGLEVEGKYSELLESLQTQSYKKRGVTVSRFCRGTSLQVKLKNGTSFFTCGESGCFFQAETLVATSFYCERHKLPKYRKKRDSLKGKATFNAYKDAMKTYSNESSQNGAVKNQFIGKKGWIRAMAKIYKQKDFEHVFLGSKIFLTVTRYGGIIYKNKNKDRPIYKCSWPDCYGTLGERVNINVDGSEKFLCSDHKSNHREFQKIIQEFQRVVDKKFCDSANDTLTLSPDA